MDQGDERWSLWPAQLILREVKSAWLELEYDNTLGLHKKGLPVFHGVKNGARAWNICKVTHAWKG